MRLDIGGISEPGPLRWRYSALSGGGGFGFQASAPMKACFVLRQLATLNLILPIGWRREALCLNGIVVETSYRAGLASTTPHLMIRAPTPLAWAEKQNITIAHIQPGKPQQNAYIERYNRTVRHEWLGCLIFDTIKEVQEHATRWLWTYNNDRPNMAIGGITPRHKLKMAA